MLLFKKLGIDKYCIIEDGEVFVFDKTGKCIGEKISISPEYVNGAIKINFVSVLSSGKNLEVCIFSEDKMDKYLSSLSPQDCVMKAYSALKPLCFLRRNGKFSDINYNQAIFICVSIDVDLVSILQLQKIED